MKNNVSDMVKNLIVVSCDRVLVLVFSNFDTRNEPDKLNYSQFVTAVATDQVKVSKLTVSKFLAKRKRLNLWDSASCSHWHWANAKAYQA